MPKFSSVQAVPSYSDDAPLWMDPSLKPPGREPWPSYAAQRQPRAWLLRRKRLIVALLASALGLLGAVPTQAQLDPGNFDLYQNGLKVGEVFVPSRLSSGAYVEDWVLFRGYVHPGLETSVVTTIVPVRARYSSESDFFARVPWGAGFLYDRVYASESTTLPGR